MSAVDQLVELLKQAGARVTYDSERSIEKPCYVCRTVTVERKLVAIGKFTRCIGGHHPGDQIMRPMCESCEEKTRA